MSKRIADGFGALGQLEDYHYSFVQEGKITLIGRKHVAQPTHNWGHRVTFSGSYALIFDKESGKWERHDIPELVTEENAEEVLFVNNGILYLLIHTNFGAVEFQKLFKWENNTFVALNLTAPAKKSFDESHRAGVIATAETTSNGNTVLISGDDEAGILIYLLAVTGSNANIELVAKVDGEENRLRGKPVLANVNDDKVLISYGVHGCGFRWENSRFFLFDLSSKTVKHVDVAGEYGDLPKYCFIGPNVSVVNKSTKSWIVASGSIQQGMTGSAHYGAVWALKNIFSEDAAPVWEEQPQTVEEGVHVIDGLTLYTVTKDSVSEVQLNNV